VLKRLRFARVQPSLEVSPDALSVRQHRLVADTPRRQLHDADVLVALSVTARVCSSLIEGPKAVALPLSPHVCGHLAEERLEGNLRVRTRTALCGENVGR
jgi:hypothetical protein